MTGWQPTPPLPAALRAVRDEAARRDHSRREAPPELVEAIMAARNQGWTYAEIGAAMGTTRQAVHELVTRRHPVRR